MKNIFLIILAILFLLMGCSSTKGNPKINDIKLVKQVKEGVTTKRDLISLFGKGVYGRQKGHEIWTYQYEDTKFNPIIGTVDATVVRLVIAFDPETDRVKEVVYVK